MSWFDTKGLASLAKTALKEAQKQIDKALDIQDDNGTLSTSMLTEQALSSAHEVVKSVPGAVKCEKSKTEPNTPSVEVTTVDSFSKRENVSVPRGTASNFTSSNWGSFTGSFFENPNAHEMVTMPPKPSAANADVSCELTSTPAVTPNTPAVRSKRQSITSNSDSVELLSSPTSPCSDLASPSETANNNSESVELITAPTTSEKASPDTPASLPDSIVIIASHEVDDDEDDSMSYNTVMDDVLNSFMDTSVATKQDTTQVSTANTSTSTSNASAKTTKLIISMDDIPVDSDSTQSFEDIQMQASDIQRFAKESESEDKVSLMKRTSQSSCSPHNSNDEMETTTSSDIEIISNPNGDSSSTNSTTRTSPLKMRKVAGSQAPTQTSAVPSKKGHYREPSEISILSVDSQSELDRLLHRISELSDILESREVRLLQLERQNAVLQERNNELQAALDGVKHNSVNLDSAEEYTQRLSALEKKFQTSIRERDSLRIQIKHLKDEMLTKIPKDDLTRLVAESNAMIAELQQEGEKLSKDILSQSNIIKKLRVKEKNSDATLKRNKEQIETLTDEVERLKKTLNAKEEVERSQIEAVHKMSSEKRKLDEENARYRSQLEDLQSKLATIQASFDAAKAELQQRSRVHTDIVRTTEEAQAAKKEREQTKAENKEIMLQLNELREKLRCSELAMAKREQQLREQNKELLRRLEAAEIRAESSTQEVSQTTVPLMRQIDALQNTLSTRTNNWDKEEKILMQKLDASQQRLKALENVESTFKERVDLLQTRCMELEEKLSQALMREDKCKIALHQAQLEYSLKESNLNKQLSSLNETLNDYRSQLKALEERNKSLEQDMLTKARDKANFSTSTDDLHRELTADALKEAAHLSDQQQRPPSPAHSYGANSLEEAVGGTDWQADDFDCSISNSGRGANAFGYGMHFSLMGHNTTTLEHLQSLLKQRDGELTHLQWELSRIQAERSVLNSEISNLTLELENVKEKLGSFETLEKSFDELQHQYDALLQMYGEKVERTQELELDLVELKEAYKVQINELLAQPPNRI